MTPEQKARQEIDRQLEQAGWVVQDFAEINISAGLGVAVREFPLTSGFADYILYADSRVIGVVEAKPKGHTLTGVETQSGKYLDGLPAGLPAHRLPLPFAYETTGEVTQFTNTLEANARSRAVFTFHRPEELIRLVKLDKQVRTLLQEMPPLNTGRLWRVQIESIVNLEKSLAENRPRALIQVSKNGSTAKASWLGRTKLAKTLYIAQTHEELDLQFNFQRFAAGPFDEAVFKLEGTARKNGWFITKERDNFGVTYHSAPKTGTMSQQTLKFLGDKQARFDRLLGHFATMDMRQAELFATTYAAWNDLLIDGRDVTEDSIIEEFYSWDDSKQKFTRAAILKQLMWMRAEGYVPSGKGERTQPRDKKTKLPSSRKRRKS